MLHTIKKVIKSKKSLIFDFDNTIALNKKSGSYTLMKIINRNNELDYDCTIEKVYKANSDYDLLNYFIKDKKKLKKVYLEVLNLNTKNVKKAYYSQDVIRLIKSLSKKYNLFIISGRDEKSLIYSLKRVGLYKYFNYILPNLKDIEPKPNPKAFNVLVKKFKLNKNRCIYIGDKEVDYNFSQNIKCKFIGVNWYKNNFKDSKNKKVIKNINEFKLLLKKRL